MCETISCAVIGIGNMGSAHARSLFEEQAGELRLAALCDIDAGRKAFCAEHYPDVPFFSDYRELLASGLVQAVIVSVPHPLHSVIAIDALRAGCHVLCEKPMDIALSRARALAAEAEKHPEQVFAVMLNQRTNPIFARAREIVQSGQLGELKRTVWIITNWYRSQHYYDSGTWRATWLGEGGGVLLNQAPHNLDLWQWICGMPCGVTGFCREGLYHRIEVEDEATLLTRYENGAQGVFITTTGEYPGTNRLEISGDRGKMVLENGTLTLWRLAESEKDFRYSTKESFPKIPCDVSTYTPEDAGTGHKGILRNFAGAILRGEKLLSPGADGINELTLSNAAYLSSWMGSKPVALPMDEALFDKMLAEKAAHSSLHEKLSESGGDGTYSDRWQTNW